MANTAGSHTRSLFKAQRLTTDPTYLIANRMTHTTVPLPRVFAIRRGTTDAYLFEARHLGGDHDRHYWAGGGGGADEYEITSFRAIDQNHIFGRHAVGLVAPDRDNRHRGTGGRVRMFIVDGHDDRDNINDWRYHNINHYIPLRRDTLARWHTTGNAIYLMTSPTPVPLLEVDADLPCSDANRVRTHPAHPRDLDVWHRHWNPARLIDRLEAGDSTDSEEEERRQRRAQRRAARAATAPAATATAPVAATPAPIPKFVADALIRDAITAAATCPITMEPLKTDTTAVTACFHLFERDAIAAWMAQSGNCCAVCKQRTAVTV